MGGVESGERDDGSGVGRGFAGENGEVEGDEELEVESTGSGSGVGESDLSGLLEEKMEKKKGSQAQLAREEVEGEKRFDSPMSRF